MLKIPNYVYGPKDITIPLDVNFGQFMLGRMSLYKDRIAQTNGATGESFTYSEIVQQSMKFAISLTRLGVRKGETIALFSENRKEYLSAFIGTACVGAICTTISSMYAEEEIKHVMHISKPKYLIVSPKMYEAHEATLKLIDSIETTILFGDDAKKPAPYYFNDLVASVGSDIDVENFIAADVDVHDVLFILYSSGTSGMPKGVTLTHLNVMAAFCMPAILNPELSSLNIREWHHSSGVLAVSAGMAFGRSGLYLENFELELFLKTIEKYKVAQVVVAPTVLVAMCKSDAKYDLSSIRFIYSSVTPLHKETISAAYKKFPNLKAIHQGYGSTETTTVIITYTYKHADIVKSGSVGLVAPNIIVKVVDIKDQRPLGPNQEGEIYVKGPLLMKGYMGRARSDDFDDEGFYRTGDVGYYDEDRHFYICDRIKEFIKCHGEQVPPAEVEAVLLLHEAVREAGVIGLKDPDAGEIPLAFVSLQPGKEATEEELKEFVAKRLSNPKHLRGGVCFVIEIPKNPSGKILRQELRKLAKSGKSKL
ncbi:4-coumarate--CoA ligase 1-like [Bombyx mandarina]|uniref:4-coumarate--CoA ligase 1-like n=1 Tax=Bombyx mandarina TaxID=7092 RepID=A0A6J2JGU8_BOMMA|nr:4-coumarate--CoA ligase 1-like [Bombyx mandarina]